MKHNNIIKTLRKSGIKPSDALEALMSRGTGAKRPLKNATAKRIVERYKRLG